jgi:hypothetical protein
MIYATQSVDELYSTAEQKGLDVPEIEGDLRTCDLYRAIFLKGANEDQFDDWGFEMAPYRVTQRWESALLRHEDWKSVNPLQNSRLVCNCLLDGTLDYIFSGGPADEAVNAMAALEVGNDAPC